MNLNLFGTSIIQSISYDQHEILSSIMNMHIKGPIECDVTYSIGNFYKKLPQPKYKFDKEPQAPGVVQALSEKLPLPDRSVKSLMYDPPFSASWNVESDEYLMKKRFKGFKGIRELKKSYAESIKEFSRVVQRNGWLVVKCQDTVYAGRQHFIHVMVHDIAEKHGFIAKDLFLLLSKNRLTGKHTQKTSRKFHSYFWVFQKSYQVHHNKKPDYD